MDLNFKIPESLDGDWAFLGYILIVTLGALSLCYLDETKAAKPSITATVYPLCFPDESIPWNHVSNTDLPNGSSVAAASKPKPSFFGILKGKRDDSKSKNADDIHLALSTRLHAYLGYALLTILGFVREAVWTISLKKSNHHKEAWNSIWWKEFFTQHMYRRIEECWGRPIASAPTSEFKVCIRERPNSGFIGQLLHGFRPLRLTGEQRKCINMASYNYLGFGGVDKDCTPACVEAVKKYGVSFGTQRADYNGGSSDLHLALEKEVATFLEKEDAIVMGMGFATNSTLIPAVVCDDSGSAKGVLILSDELNHKSIVEGCRLSGASIKSVKHSDMEHLEKVLKEETEKKTWKKIFLFVEGVYSMEGGYCKLREVVRLKRKYGIYVWLDEAHSIGGVGPTGRGVTDLFQVPTKYIDIMMGTFTKSFGSAGGYIAGDRALMNKVRRLSVGFIEASSMTPVCAQQALSAFKAMQSPRGMRKIKQLRENCDYFRDQLVNLGCRVVGDLHSPVVCAMLVHPEKIAAFSTECLKRNLAVVVVGFPATPVLLSRVRFCLSASHTQRDLDRVIETLTQVVDKVGIKYAEGEEPLDVEELMKQALHIDLGKDEERISYWKPEPLVSQNVWDKDRVVPKFRGGKIDASRHDPLSLLSNPPSVIVNAAIDKLNEVGCGTCGPRGFYGTTTDHLNLEKTIADFLGTECAIVYSHHVSTASSVIPAFIKKDDVVMLRSDPIGTCSLTASGVRLSKASNVSSWTSCEELEALLKAAAASATLRTDPYSRIWILCEGGTPHLDLKRIVELKLAFGAYLLLDDTYCIGVTGSAGRGTVERCGVRVSDIDCLIGSLEHAFGAVGGFCAGRADIIEHQRLYGDGYCFSASAPSCLTVAAMKAIEFIQTDAGKARLQYLQDNIELFVNSVHKKMPQVEFLTSRSDYMQILKVPASLTADEVYEKISDVVKTQPLQVSSLGLKLLTTFQAKNFGTSLDRLLRVNISSVMTPNDVHAIVDALAAVIEHSEPTKKHRSSSSSSRRN
jgi:serine palmitoyltransferase